MQRVIIGCIFILAFSVITIKSVGASDYVGSRHCASCHAEQYNDFWISGHPHKLTRAKDARKRAIPLPTGYTWKDISYVIGGAYKKARYINKQGYIITAAKDGSALKTQYNLETNTWSYYHKGEKKPYSCGRCHTTGYKKQGHQGGLPGIKGTWAAPGVQCEACHGPGGEHARTGGKSKIKVDRSSTFCGQCHVRGDKARIPAKKGFIRHHQQWNELYASPHKKISCVSCHNPHKKYSFSIKKSCASCHTSAAKSYQGSKMQQLGVRCIDCHMPRATKSATKQSRYVADIRTHLFKININKRAKMFYRAKYKGKYKTFSRGFVTLDFACLSCHKDKDINWAGKYARKIHSLGKR